MMFLPLIIYGLYEILVGDNKKWWILALGLFGVGNSHILSFIFSIGLVIIICLIFVVKLFREKDRMHKLLISILASVVLCIGFYGPFLEQYLSGKYNGDYFKDNRMRDMSATVSEVLNGQFKLGYLAYQEDKDVAEQPVFSLGIGLVIILLAGSIIITKKDRDKDVNKFIISLFVIGAISLLFTTNLVPWEKLDFLIFIQFPFRFNIVATICLSFVAAKCVYDFVSNKRDTIFILSFVILLFSGYLMSSVKPNMAGALSDKYWSVDRPEVVMYGSDGIEILGGREYVSKDTTISDTKTYYYSSKKEIDSYRDGKKLIFQFDGENNNDVVKVPLIYYPGYQAYLKTEDGKKYNLKVEKDKLTGQVLVSGGSGLKGLVTVEYKMTFIQFICYTISTIAFIGLVVYIIKYYKKCKKENGKEIIEECKE